MRATEGPRSETEVLEAGQSVLADRLPAGWAVRLGEGNQPENSTDRPDAIVEVVSPEGVPARLVAEAKRSVEGRDVAAIRQQLRETMSGFPNSGGVVVARYLSPPVRQRLAEAGLSYVDATGNVRMSLARPGLFVSDRGADRDPWRGPGRPRGTLKGAPAAKVVRALVDFDKTWSVRELVETAQVSTGSVYRVVAFLEDEELIAKDGSDVSVPRWQPLLRRWSRDYEFVGSSRVTRWIALRGLPRLMARVAAEPFGPYAVTGTFAAAEWSPYAPARSAMIYVANADRAAEAWDLRPAEAGANVILAEPESDVAFARTGQATDGGYTIAAPAQVAVDLMTGPGRSPSEAEELIEWMTRNEQSWRQ